MTMTTMNNNDNEKVGEHVMLVFSWERILTKFIDEFCEAFSSSKKAHFDCLPEEYSVIDGARVKWCELVLLDALIFFLSHNTFNLSTRRCFNQQKVLFEAIMEELEIEQNSIILSKCDIASLSLNRQSDGQQMLFIPDYTNNDTIAKDVAITVIGLRAPWKSLDQLQRDLNDAPTTKSRHKWWSCIEMLFTHQAIVDMHGDMEAILKVVIFKAVNVFNKNRLLSAFSCSRKRRAELEAVGDDDESSNSNRRASKRVTSRRKVPPATSNSIKQPTLDNALSDSPLESEIDMELARFEMSARIASIVAANKQPHLLTHFVASCDGDSAAILQDCADEVLKKSCAESHHCEEEDEEDDWLSNLFEPVDYETLTRQSEGSTASDEAMDFLSTCSTADLERSLLEGEDLILSDKEEGACFQGFENRDGDLGDTTVNLNCSTAESEAVSCEMQSEPSGVVLTPSTVSSALESSGLQSSRLLTDILRKVSVERDCFSHLKVTARRMLAAATHTPLKDMPPLKRRFSHVLSSRSGPDTNRNEIVYKSFASNKTNGEISPASQQKVSFSSNPPVVIVPRGSHLLPPFSVVNPLLTTPRPGAITTRIRGLARVSVTPTIARDATSPQCCASSELDCPERVSNDFQHSEPTTPLPISRSFSDLFVTPPLTSAHSDFPTSSGLTTSESSGSLAMQHEQQSTGADVPNSLPTLAEMEDCSDETTGGLSCASIDQEFWRDVHGLFGNEEETGEEMSAESRSLVVETGEKSDNKRVREWESDLEHCKKRFSVDADCSTLTTYALQIAMSSRSALQARGGPEERGIMHLSCSPNRRQSWATDRVNCLEANCEGPARGQVSAYDSVVSSLGSVDYSSSLAADTACAVTDFYQV